MNLIRGERERSEQGHGFKLGPAQVGRGAGGLQLPISAYIPEHVSYFQPWEINTDKHLHARALVARRRPCAPNVFGECVGGDQEPDAHPEASGGLVRVCGVLNNPSFL